MIYPDNLIFSAEITNGYVFRQIFELYDTYGFPSDLTSLILSEQNLSFNQTDFNIAMQEQKNRSKKSGKIEKGDWEVEYQTGIFKSNGRSEEVQEDKESLVYEVL